jgi:serine/threonine protein kinase
MPAISEILDSIKVPALIKDDLIRKGTFETTSKGVKFYSGGFTVVFPVVVEHDKWAFRCWHTELGNVRKRFKIISDYINNLKSPYFCDFYYCDEGLVVEGKVFPTTRMKWVDGVTINTYILDNKDNQAALHKLGDEFIRMIDFLHSNKIAHGDLQHGNIIVQNGDIKLVDYDSLFCPGLEGESDIITGKADFQHPKRKDAKIATAKLDYFSELVIYLSIIAVAECPKLTDEFSLEDSLLFQASDWNDFTNSAVYKRLASLGNDDITILLEILNEYLAEDDINNLRPFTELWRERLAVPKINNIECGHDGVVFNGVESTIKWDVENVASQFINSQPVNSSARESKMTFDHDGEIVLTVKNGLHTVEKRLSIKTVEKPIIVFNSGKKKLRKTASGVESAMLSWSVENAHKVELKANNKVLSSEISAQGFAVNPDSDTKYQLVVTGLDRCTQFTQSIAIQVRKPADIVFESDKQYTLPGVPVLLKWNVSHCSKVILEQQEVSKSGTQTVSPEENKQYTLVVEDEFGETTKTLSIQMLPLPIVKSIMVPVPKIERNLSIAYRPPQFNPDIAIPSVETEFGKLDLPKIPDLKDSGYYVELSNQPHRKLSERISRFVNKIFRKQSI